MEALVQRNKSYNTIKLAAFSRLSTNKSLNVCIIDSVFFKKKSYYNSKTLQVYIIDIVTITLSMYIRVYIA
jgi:hypothetical protein